MFAAVLSKEHRTVIEPTTERQENLPYYIQDFLKDHIDRKIRYVETNLKFSNIETVVIGAMACGHYDGPKPRHHSLNPACPSKFSEVIECDLRVLVPESVDVEKNKNVKHFEAATESDPKHTWKGEVKRFGMLVPTARMYSYEAILPDLAIEYEYCFTPRPYYEICKVWHQVFTPDEIDYQRNVRRLARDVLNLDYATDYSTIKGLQTKECRYRICANYWMQQMHPEYTTDPNLGFVPLREPMIPIIQRIVDHWSDFGHQNVNVDGLTPVTFIPHNIIKRFRAQGLAGFLTAPESPLWLTLAEQLRNK